MDFLASTILSGILYDGFKAGAKLTADFLKERLQGWLFDEMLLKQLTDELLVMQLDDFSEKIIEKKINESPAVLEKLQQIRPDKSINSAIQTHYGSGDNVVNKTVYNK
jgi:hypothetical protein